MRAAERGELVMSSGLCKQLEGAVFPLRMKSVRDRISDPVHARQVHKADPGPGSPAAFDAAAFHHLGGVDPYRTAQPPLGSTLRCAAGTLEGGGIGDARESG